jgi:ABC-type phosphate transport system substrate-binding protein
MTSRRTFLALLCGSFLLGQTIGTSSAAGVEQGKKTIAVVVAKHSSVSNLSLFQLKRLYLGDKLETPTGQKMVALNRGTSSKERRGFDKNVLGLSAEEAARYWIDRRIRGQSGAPRAVDPAAVVQTVVSNVPGAISYVTTDQLSDKVKVVRVDGKLPNEPGYPIFSTGDTSALATRATASLSF